MFRQAMNALTRWKERPDRKPLIIRGARQVGKTWLMKEFGKTSYQNVAYINFDNNLGMKELFNGDFSVERLIKGLQIETGKVIDAGTTLLIFDEIQEVPRALTALKYFCENAPHYQIVSAGSLLGVALHPGSSFPVGKVEFLDLYPLDFLEFLQATGNDNLAGLLESLDMEMITAFRDRFVDLLKQYYFVGGMPEVIVRYLETNDIQVVREVQQSILLAYEQDFSKHAPTDAVPRIRMLWGSIPAQLAKENRKFVYGLVRQGARAKDYEAALTWLSDCGLIYKVGRITNPAVPLSAYQDFDAFKLYILDVGLLAALSGIDARSLLEGSRFFGQFKGALTEQYVLQQLLARGKVRPFYWSAEKSTGEIDFIFQFENHVVPLEVKAAENLQAKSLRNYCQKYSPRQAVRTSLSNFRREEWLVNVPLYAVPVLTKLLAQEAKR
jgi:predicted AAA+ superfamily ATPase